MSGGKGVQSPHTPEPGPCPPWCTLASGHGWDSLDGPERRPSRVHAGPRFGDAVAVVARQYADAEGHVEWPKVEVIADDAYNMLEAQDLARHIGEALDWLGAEAKRLAWWRTHPNPQCRPWCTREHASDDFAGSGALLCDRSIDVGGRARVLLQQLIEADERPDAEPGSVVLAPIEVEVVLESTDTQEEHVYRLDSVAALVEDLPAALRTALDLAEVADGQDR